MNRLAEVLDVARAALPALDGRVALIPAAFVVCFLVRLERWHRPVSRAVEAIRSRIAEGGEP